jgi:preprotein translocase subunit YajC
VRAGRSGIRADPSSVRKTETITVLFSLLLQQQPTNSIALFAPYILIALVFYFLLFMPMQKQKKKLADMLKNLKNGDVVSTSGGIVGTIVSVDPDTIVLRVKPDNLKLQFSRAAVSSIVLPEAQK